MVTVADYINSQTIRGHPSTELEGSDGTPVVITVCAECGEMRSVMWLDRDRWFCRSCRAEGAAPPNMFPIA